MHYVTLWLFLGLAAVAGSAPVLTLPRRSLQLENGMNVHLVKYPSAGVVAFQLAVRVGSRDEVEKGKTGFAHFFEHLMFRGTKKISGKEFGQLFARSGAENNAWTWFDFTVYHGVSGAQALPALLAAESDRFANLYFDEKLFKDEAGAVLGEYNKSASDPEFFVEEKLLMTAFRTHPYAHTTMGFKEDILAFPRRYEDVWPFFRRYYRPDNVSLVLVGDIDFASAEALARLHFGGWKAQPEEPVRIPEEPLQEGPRQEEISWPKQAQTRIAVAYKVPPFGTRDTDFAALRLLAETGFSKISDFQKTFVFRHQWVDEVEASPLEMRDPGLWTVSARLSEQGRAHEAEVVRGILDVVKGFREKDVPKKTLGLARRRFRNAALARWFEGPATLAGRISWYTSFEGDLDVINRIFDRIDAVSPAEIRTFANRYLTDARRTSVILRGTP